MQDIQNIPNPDVNSTEHDDDFGSHSDFPNTDVEQPTVFALQCRSPLLIKLAKRQRQHRLSMLLA